MRKFKFLRCQGGCPVALFLPLLLLMYLGPLQGWSQAYQDWARAFGSTTQSSSVVVRTGQHVELSGTILARTVTVQAGGVLRFAPGSSGHLRVVGNVVVEGLLQARPSRLAVEHRLTFEKVNEADFVGGGMSVLATDVGLWVMHQGKLDLRGSRKTPHARLAGAALAGTTSLTLEAAPEGWRAGDQLVVTPMQPATNKNNYLAYDEALLAKVSGAGVTLSAALRHDHLELRGEHAPAGWRGRTRWTARVLNLSRNVVVEGTPEGHAHTFIHSSGLQVVEDVEFRFMGPSRTAGANTTDILGRYPLHFHHAGAPEGFPGQYHRVSRAVVHGSRGRAFVPHETTGVRFEGCVSHDVQFDAFWWDTSEPSTHIEFLNCVASKTYGPARPVQRRLSGFRMGTGEYMLARGNLAVGTQGGGSSAGYVWGEGQAGRWDFDSNEAFCNRSQGIFTWQNSGLPHDITDTVLGWNGDAGIDHGAYRNIYQYHRMWLIGNRNVGLRLHSSSASARRQSFTDFSVEGQGVTQYALELRHPSLLGNQSTLLDNWKISNLTSGLVNVLKSGGSGHQEVRLSNWDHDLPDQSKWFFLHSESRALNILQVRNFTGQKELFDVRRADFPEGILVPAWNAKKIAVAADDYTQPAITGKLVLQEGFAGPENSPWPRSRWSKEVKHEEAKVDIEGGRGRLHVTSTGGMYARATATDAAGTPLSLLEVAVTGRRQFSNIGKGGQFSVFLRSSGGDGSGQRPLNGYEIRNNSESGGGEIYRIIDGVAGKAIQKFHWPDEQQNGEFDIRLAGKEGAPPVFHIQTWDAGESRPGGFKLTFTDKEAPAVLRQAGQVGVGLTRRSGGPHTVLMDKPFRIFDLSAADNGTPPDLLFFPQPNLVK